jgi:hypothetical protein
MRMSTSSLRFTLMLFWLDFFYTADTYSSPKVYKLFPKKCCLSILTKVNRQLSILWQFSYSSNIVVVVVVSWLNCMILLICNVTLCPLLVISIMLIYIYTKSGGTLTLLTLETPPVLLHYNKFLHFVRASCLEQIDFRWSGRIGRRHFYQ